jgi:hypothetical protein
LIVSVYVDPVPAQALLSVAVTVIGNEPDWVGVPESTPVAEFRVMPVGSAPVFDHVMVPMPPLCVNVWLKAAFTVPVFTPGFVTVIVWQEMTNVYVGLMPVQALLSVALTVIGKEPVCVGVPESVPLVANDRPVGRLPLLRVKFTVPTPPLWVNVWLKGTPAVPVLVAGFVTVNVQPTVIVTVAVSVGNWLLVAV